MAVSLNKLFTYVQTSDCAAFRLKYIEPAEGQTRDTGYDCNLVFLEDTQELFTRGTVFGINNVEALNLLAEYVGEIPDTSSATSIVGYIQEVFGSIGSISNEKIDALFS